MVATLIARMPRKARKVLVLTVGTLMLALPIIACSDGSDGAYTGGYTGSHWTADTCAAAGGTFSPTLGGTCTTP